MPGVIGDDPRRLAPLGPQIDGLRQHAALDVRPRGGGRRRALTALLVVGALLAALAGWHLLRAPAAIGDVELVGDRSPAAVDVLLLLDESGSFAAHRAVREEAIAQLTRWAPDNLRPDDTITIVGFAGDAVVRLQTTTVGALAAEEPRLSTDAVAGGGTSIRPALAESTAALPETGGIRTIIAVTDTLVDDAETGALDAAVAGLDANTMSVVTPAGVPVQADWRRSFPWERELHADPASAGSTSLAIADALAHATGQSVQRR